MTIKTKNKITFSNTILILGLVFLYLPMLILVIYSFNESRLVTVWAGFSTKWYGELIEDQQLLEAIGMSLKIAFWLSFTTPIRNIPTRKKHLKFG